MIKTYKAKAKANKAHKFFILGKKKLAQFGNFIAL